MMRSHASPARWLTLLGLLALAHSAQAQSATTNGAANLTVKLMKIGDKTYNTVANRPVNDSECADDALTLTFRIEGLPGGGSNSEYIEVWAGTSCNETTRKDTTTGKDCEIVGSKEITDTQTTLDDFEIPVSTLCDKEGDRKLFFLAVNTLDSADAVTYYGINTVNIDSTAPRAPTKVRGGSGETEIPVKWKTSDEDVDHYLVVWDPNASSSASPAQDAAVTTDEDGGTAAPAGPTDCSSLVLMGNDDLGGDLKLLPDGIEGKRVDGKVESTTLSGETLGSKLAAVGVIAIDLAGNASPVSNIACLRVVPTTGFWDQYRANGGAIDEGCACSLPGKSSTNVAAWPVLLAFGALVMRARRRPL